MKEEIVSIVIQAENFANEEERKELAELMQKAFPEATFWDRYEDTDLIEIYDEDYYYDISVPWKKKIIDCFGEWLEKHPHVKFRASILYEELCPEETILIENGRIEQRVMEEFKINPLICFECEYWNECFEKFSDGKPFKCKLIGKMIE